MNEEMDKCTIIVVDFNTSPSVIDRVTGQKVSKNTEDTDNTSSHINLFDI